VERAIRGASTCDFTNGERAEAGAAVTIGCVASTFPIDLGTLGMTEIVRLQNQLQQELTRRFERSLLMVFSDIVGSTPYFARFGDAVGRQLHQLHFDLLGQCAAAAQGRVVDAVGDGVFCVFPSAEAGLRGVVAFHHAAARENATRVREHQLTVRIGMHWGSVLTDGVAVTGDSVHVAARVARVAEPGAIVLTRQVFQELGPALRLNCHAAGTRELKGVAQPVELLEFDWRDPAAFPRRVRVEETGEQFDLPQQDIVAFGRLAEHEGARANDIVLVHPDPVRARQVSRWQFELRRSADGLRLRPLSEAQTTVDGQPVPRGSDVPVRSGTRVGVAGTLTLCFTGPARRDDDEDSRTMLLKPAAG
jgi:class 3 adenylate cyclase